MLNILSPQLRTSLQPRSDCWEVYDYEYVEVKCAKKNLIINITNRAGYGNVRGNCSVLLENETLSKP